MSAKPLTKTGEFKRKASSFRNEITKDGQFSPEKGRYHLYVCHGCPWAHRTTIVRELKGLQSIVGLSVVDWKNDSKGWKFADSDDNPPAPGVTVDHVYGYKRISQHYLRADPEYEGRYTVPVLWDTKLGTIVNNESSEIIRIFNSAFDELLEPNDAKVDLYPKELRSDIDALNDWVYSGINNGVSKAGFTNSQEVYDREVKNVFDSLDRVEGVLKKQNEKGSPYLIGNQLTEADVRLYVTIIRFDPVYYFHAKCNLGTIRDDYPYLHKWVRNLYWNNPAFKNTTHFDHIKGLPFASQLQVNPTGIIPAGPRVNILPLDE